MLHQDKHQTYFSGDQPWKELQFSFEHLAFLLTHRRLARRNAEDSECRRILMEKKHEKSRRDLEFQC